MNEHYNCIIVTVIQLYNTIILLYGYCCRGHLSIKSHSEIRPEEPAARLCHFDYLIVGSVQGIVQSAQLLENK